MGEPMASHLVRKGFGVTVIGHRRREPVERLIALGATEAAQAKDAARDAGVAVLMVPGSDEVDALAFGPEGLLASMRAGAVLLDCSTSDPGRSAALARAAAERGVGYVDAPVTRGVQGARDAKLAFFIGGDDRAVEAVQPLLAAMGDTFMRMGPAGSGHATKILVQTLSYGTVALVNEALMLGSRAGLAAGALQEALMAGAGSKALEAFGPRISGRQYQPARVAVGDAQAHLAAGRRLAQALGCERRVHDAAADALAAASSRGMDRSDIAALAEIWPQPLTA
jgi:3-hydroxyisobutyrate dehydrogenase-like beta-hydroxyacid dehydrogenase